MVQLLPKKPARTVRVLQAGVGRVAGCRARSQAGQGGSGEGWLLGAPLASHDGLALLSVACRVSSWQAIAAGKIVGRPVG